MDWVVPILLSFVYFLRGENNHFDICMITEVSHFFSGHRQEKGRNCCSTCHKEI